MYQAPSYQDNPRIAKRRRRFNAIAAVASVVVTLASCGVLAWSTLPPHQAITIVGGLIAIDLCVLTVCYYKSN